MLSFTAAVLRSVSFFYGVMGRVKCTEQKWIHETNCSVMDVIAHIKESRDALRQATRHVLTRVAKCIDVDGGILENLLY